MCIREYYKKDNDNTWYAGRKGINLTELQWQTLKELSPHIDEVVAKCTGNDSDCVLCPSDVQFHLEGPKYVVYDFFKSKAFVSIREYKKYTCNGSLYPTKTGIHLTVSQWQLLKNMFVRVDNVIKNF